MQGQCQGFISTKPATEEEEEEKEECEKIGPRQHDIIITIHDMSLTLYINQIEKFPRTSSRGNKYQMILHDIESNWTWFKPMKNQTKDEIIIYRECALTWICLYGLT